MIQRPLYDYRITFFVKKQLLPPPMALQLVRLAKKFKNTIRIDNITKGRFSDISGSLCLFKVGLTEGDFCQLITTGIDAELANFVLTDLLANTFDFIASDKLWRFSSTLIEKHPQLIPACDIDFHYVKAQAPLLKFDILKGLSKLISPYKSNELLLSLIKREEKSSTYMAKHIALPHVISDFVDKPCIAIIRSDYAIDWASKMGGIHLVIALILPTSPSRDMIITATKLTRSLLDDDFAQRLIATRHAVGLQALLLYSMCKTL